MYRHNVSFPVIRGRCRVLCCPVRCRRALKAAPEGLSACVSHTVCTASERATAHARWDACGQTCFARCRQPAAAANDSRRPGSLCALQALQQQRSIRHEHTNTHAIDSCKPPATPVPLLQRAITGAASAIGCRSCPPCPATSVLLGHEAWGARAGATSGWAGAANATARSIGGHIDHDHGAAV